jgi:thiamine pyrophosphate-dependent acetolactate synthase large subunit-like protein
MGTMGFGLPAAIGAQFANGRTRSSSTSTAMQASA